MEGFSGLIVNDIYKRMVEHVGKIPSNLSKRLMVRTFKWIRTSFWNNSKIITSSFRSVTDVLIPSPYALTRRHTYFCETTKKQQELTCMWVGIDEDSIYPPSFPFGHLHFRKY
jgi:hypothetical protein